MNLLGLSELQLSLIVIGLMAVGGVWLYNLWLERRHRQQARQIFHEDRHDVLMQAVVPPQPAASDEPPPTDDEWLVRPEVPNTRPHDEAAAQDIRAAGAGRLEPCWQEAALTEPAMATDRPVADPADSAASFVPGGAAAHVSPPDMGSAAPECEPAPRPQPQAVTADEVTEHAPSASAAHAAAASPEALGGFPVLDNALESEPPFEYADDAIDCVVQLNAANLISAPLFWSAQRQLLSRLAGRLNWIGLDENSGQWQRLHAQDANSYRRLVAALQLVDRQGPVAADDLALFCDGVRQLAAHYQAEAIVPVVADVVARANALDAFCASVDWRLALNLVHKQGQGLPLSAIIPLASAANLQRASQADDGQLHAVDAHAQTQFTLGLLGLSETTAAGLTLAIDVPRVSDGVAAFERMLHLARHLCQHLDAQIVDDQRQPLSEETLALIRDKIGEFQLQMKAHKIPAGGRRAQRLYA